MTSIFDFSELDPYLSQSLRISLLKNLEKKILNEVQEDILRQELLNELVAIKESMQWQLPVTEKQKQMYDRNLLKLLRKLRKRKGWKTSSYFYFFDLIVFGILHFFLMTTNLMVNLGLNVWIIGLIAFVLSSIISFLHYHYNKHKGLLI